MTRQRKVQLLLWTYFWLLIFEGALRKWVVPELSNVLLVVRDPVAIAAIWVGLPFLLRNSVKKWVLSIYAIGALAFLLAVLAGHGDVIIAAYGTRILWLHFPLIFLYGFVFSHEDVWRFAKMILWLAIPMVVLMGFQYSLPQSHPVNVAPGGEGSMSISGALDRYRPPGFFSHSSGMGNFWGLSAGMLLGWLLSGPRPLPVWIWFSSAAAVLALPISITRSMVFYYGLIFLFGIAGCLLAGRAVKNLIIGLFILAVVGFGVSRFEIFQDATTTFQARWQGAEAFEAEGEGVAGVLKRRIGGSILSAASGLGKAKVFGEGIGLGTNVGAVRKTGQKGFLLAEGSLPLIVSELGPVLGLALIFWRAGLAVKLILLAVTAARRGNLLPICLAGMATHIVILGQTSQPTILGFLVLIAGLALAACNAPRVPKRKTVPLVYFDGNFESPGERRDSLV
jgi:hypothetical protein